MYQDLSVIRLTKDVNEKLKKWMEWTILEVKESIESPLTEFIDDNWRTIEILPVNPDAFEAVWILDEKKDRFNR